MYAVSPHENINYENLFSMKPLVFSQGPGLCRQFTIVLTRTVSLKKREKFSELHSPQRLVQFWHIFPNVMH